MSIFEFFCCGVFEVCSFKPSKNHGSYNIYLNLSYTEYRCIIIITAAYSISKYVHIIIYMHIIYRER